MMVEIGMENVSVTIPNFCMVAAVIVADVGGSAGRYCATFPPSQMWKLMGR
jgi:hypothetical protein